MDFCKNNGNADPEALKKDQLHCGMVLCDQIVLLRGVRLYNCAACLHCYISKFCVCDSFFPVFLPISALKAVQREWGNSVGENFSIVFLI